MDVFSAFDFYTIVVSQEQIEKRDTSLITNILKKIIDNIDSEEVEKYQGKFQITFDGYNFDERELWEIQEVRAWISKFISENPTFFYFSYIKTILLFTLAVLQARRMNNNQLYIEPAQIQGYLNYHIFMMNKVFEYTNFSQDKIGEITSEIINTFRIK